MGFSRQEYWSGVPLPSLEKYYYILFNYDPIIDCAYACLFFSIVFTTFGGKKNGEAMSFSRVKSLVNQTVKTVKTTLELQIDGWIFTDQ